MKTTLLLQGFMGTGKSTVGRIVAQRAGASFIDLDDLVAERAGRSIPEIFAAEGEPAFRRMEADALAHVLQMHPGCIVALGGGALLDRVRRRDALDRAHVITLVARPDTIDARTRGRGRPLLDAAPDRLARIRELLEARAEAYAEAHARISTDDLSADDVASAVEAAWKRPAVAVPLGTRSYAVQFTRDEAHVAASAIASLAPSGVFVVTDENVHRFWGAKLADALAARALPVRATVVVPPGEQHKQLVSVERALATMVGAGADRDAVVVGHGGGVVTDMAGLAAALLLRGVRWVTLPTTLLAMVDASVGGKTGVDLGPAKNAVGAFHQPSSVVVDSAHVTTESARAFTNGLAEVVKSAAIGDPALFDLLEARADAVRARDLETVEEIAIRSISVKAAIVARDERESGDRALLNFGHTIGHALESEGGYARLMHGEAVSLGMVAALRIGVALGLTARPTADRVTRLLARLGLPTDLGAQPLATALPLVALDKKRQRGSIRFVVLEAIGRACVRPIPMNELSRLLDVANFADGNDPA